MAKLPNREAPARLLCLGNDLLADDAFGLRVAEEVRRRFGPELDVVCSSSAGLHLLDDVLGVERLLVIDTIVTGDEKPGTVFVFHEGQVRCETGGSPHASGLFDVLRRARELGLAVPKSVTVVCVEAGDCTTIGGTMSAAVEDTMEPVLQIVEELCHV